MGKLVPKSSRMNESKFSLYYSNRYRAILGPFRWEVWLALIITYLFGILPLAFSDKHTLRHLYHNSGEVENMFWYVFGTFTNCFTFVGKNSWSRTTKVTTRLLIGLYWIFTIIITSCYTGSIIAFVTLPIYPQTVDTIDELIGGFYRVGTLDKGGWEHWFSNTSDPATEKLFKHLEYVPDVQAGLKNITTAFFWPYAFLGSRAQLEYIGRVNFSLESAKRSVLHISQNCFVPFSVAMVFPKESVYTEKFNNVIARMFQTGLIDKIERDVKWEMQRSATGKLLKINSGRSLKSIADQEKGLTLDDTQGMFLLLSAGFLMAAAALISECVGGCSRWCGAFIKDKMGNSQVTIERVDSAALPTPETKSNNDVEFHEENDSQAVSRLNKSRMDQIDNISNRSSESVEGHIIEVFAEVNEAWRDPRPSFSRASSKDIDEEIDQIFKMADEDPAITPQSSENGHGGHKSSIFGEKVNA